MADEKIEDKKEEKVKKVKKEERVIPQHDPEKPIDLGTFLDMHSVTGGTRLFYEKTYGKPYSEKTPAQWVELTEFKIED